MDPVSHKPIEQQEDEEKTETILTSNSSTPREGSLGVPLMIMEKHTKNEKKQTEGDMNLDEISEVLNGYEMVGVDAGLWMNQGTTNPNSSGPNSCSLEESLNPSMGESNSIQQWVDSMLSLDGFNQLEEVLLFLKNCQ